MADVLEYGTAPFRAAVVHGGPGARGGAAAELARDLNIAARCGVLELRQTKYTIADLIEECASQLKAHCDAPVVLIGHSWGAWLAVLTAAQFPAAVKKVIAVGCPPLRPGIDVDARRKANFSEAQLRWYDQAVKSGDWAWLGRICDAADSFAQGEDFGQLDCDFDLEQFKKVWQEAETMRNTGKIEEAFVSLSVPLTVIHGDCDPHPGFAVKEVLEERQIPFAWRPLSKCGHTPWRELYARGPFFKLLLEELK